MISILSNLQLVLYKEQILQLPENKLSDFSLLFVQHAKIWSNTLLSFTSFCLSFSDSDVIVRRPSLWNLINIRTFLPLTEIQCFHRTGNLNIFSQTFRLSFAHLHWKWISINWYEYIYDSTTDPPEELNKTFSLQTSRDCMKSPCGADNVYDDCSMTVRVIVSWR